MAPTVKKTTTTKKTQQPKITKTVTSEMAVDVVSLSGKKQADMPVVDATLFKVKVAPSIIAQAIRVHRVNTRQGTLSTKTRGEVTGSTRKIYRQKGTGRARHGAITAPIFVGGGITFGPKPRAFELKLPKKIRHQVFAAVLADKIKTKKLHIVSDLAKASGKTREIVTLLKNLNLTDKKMLFVIAPAMEKTYQGARNVARVTVKLADSLSYMDILEHETVVMAQEAFDQVVKRMQKA